MHVGHSFRSVALVCAALALAAGCGSQSVQQAKVATAGGAATTAGQAQAPKADPVRFAQCMREAGIDMPDPTNAGGGGVIKIETAEAVEIGADGKPVAGDEFRAALERCQQHMPVGAGGPNGVPEDVKKQLLDMARCMRTNGFPDFPDPDFNGGAVMLGGRDAPITDPAKFEATMSTCNKASGLHGGPAEGTGTGADAGSTGTSNG